MPWRNCELNYTPSTGIVDKDCNTVVEYSYDAWGKLLSTTGSLAGTVGKVNPFLYRGYCYDSETGFYYLNSRYYDPQTGRFLNADGAISTGTGIGGYNMFAYCNNNTVNMADDGGSRPLAMDDTVENQIIAAKYNSEAHRKTVLAAAKAKSMSATTVISQISKNAFQGYADLKLGQAIDKLPKYIHEIKRVGPGIGMEIESYTESISTAALKRFAKVGIVATGAYIWDLYSDYQSYTGNDFYKAATVSSLEFLSGVALGLIMSGVGAPVGAALGIGLLAGIATGAIGDIAKKQWIGY